MGWFEGTLLGTALGLEDGIFELDGAWLGTNDGDIDGDIEGSSLG